MFPKDNRLSKVRDFNLLMKYGRWQRGQFLDIKALELAKIRVYWPKKIDLESFSKQLKLAISVGLKVSKSAVKRNRAKRQIREYVRPLLRGGKIKEGFYILINARVEVLTKNFTEISQEVELLLRRSNLFLE